MKGSNVLHSNYEYEYDFMIKEEGLASLVAIV